jgi:prepilin-type N-terminal cleavage/methylation domain-containing protein
MFARSRSCSAFTLIEILVALALIALASGLLVGNLGTLLKELGPEPLPDQLQSAIQEARYQAAVRKESVLLRFDPDTATFILTSSQGNTIQTLPTHLDPEEETLLITFRQYLPERGLNARSRPETVEIDAVRFNPDRSSTPFLAEVREGPNESTHRFDPFSDLELAERL